MPSDPGEQSNVSENEKELVVLCNQAYEFIGDDFMPHVQKMLHRVCQELNELDWKPYCKVTPDFAVAAADGSRCFGGDQDDADILESIPKEKLDLLKKKRIYYDNDDDRASPVDRIGYVVVAAAKEQIAKAKAK